MGTQWARIGTNFSQVPVTIQKVVVIFDFFLNARIQLTQNNLNSKQIYRQLVASKFIKSFILKIKSTPDSKERPNQ